MKAHKRIMLIGWDFDARIRLISDGHEPGEPETVGEFIFWLIDRNPELEVFLLRWDVGALKALVRGSTALTVFKWMRHPRIHTKLDGHHPTGSSHHQKIVAIDDCFAFCGGIDMTGDRWDTREHVEADPRRLGPTGKAYAPWHDATSALQGPVAAVLGELARERWHVAGGHRIDAVEGVSDCWPEPLEPDFENIDVGIARTRPEMPGCPEVREIEGLFVEQISKARQSIYAESQYFASRRIAEAIAKRLEETGGPEIVIVNPLTASGWLEPLAMDTARARLVAALGARDKDKRFRVYYPVTETGSDIYVHAKVMIVDGVSLRIGSANMNNRSLGLDTECDIVIEAGTNDPDAVTIRAIRDGLLAEHLGVAAERVAAAIDAEGSLIGAIEKLRGSGRSLRLYEIPDLSATEAWLADNEVLDPESPSEMFETTTAGLFRRMSRFGRK